MTKDLKNYVVDDHPKIKNFDKLSREDLINEIKNLQELNRYHQETNGELRTKMASVRELRRENTKLRDKLEELQPLVLTDEVALKVLINDNYISEIQRQMIYTKNFRIYDELEKFLKKILDTNKH